MLSVMHGELEGFTPFDPNVEIRCSRRKLPHWEQRGCTYFVTFRLGDSIPAVKLEEWKAERDIWRAQHPEPWTSRTWVEYQERFLSRIERWSDAGWGSSLLRDPSIRDTVDRAFRFFDGDRYQLDRFVTMPNHVHLLFRLMGEWTLERVLHSWKSFTAHRINELRGRAGRVWMDERFDHIVRSSAQLDHFRRYIEENPRKARLSQTEYTHWNSDEELQGRDTV